MIKILIYFSSETLIKDITKVLKSLKYLAIITDKQENIFELIERESPDVILIDTLGSNNIIKELKKRYSRIPIICWMHKYDSCLAVSLLNLGAIDCLYPPINPKDIDGVIKKALSKSLGNIGEIKILDDKDKKRFQKISIYISSILGFLIIIGVYFLLIPSKVVLDLPFKNPTCIISDKKNLWIGDWYTQSIYHYILSNGRFKLVDTNYFSDFGPILLSKDGSNIWTLGNDLNIRKHMDNNNLDEINRYKFDLNLPSGMCVKGNNMWIYDKGNKIFYHYSLESGMPVLVDTYNFPIDENIGLVLENNLFWTMDAKTNIIYSFYINSDKILINKKFKLPNSDKLKISGFYKLGKWIYIIRLDNPPKLIKFLLRD